MMLKNRIGTLFSLTSFGESHGLAIGGVIDGMPAGIKVDFVKIQQQVDRRRPGQSKLTTSRSEADKVEFLSGFKDDVSLGTPIGFIIRNKDQHSGDYSAIADCYRPNHADYTYEAKYGVRDARGGGRASARETVSRVVAGALAQQVLSHYGISVTAYTTQVGTVVLSASDSMDLSVIDNNDIRCPNSKVAALMEQAIIDARATGDSLGGVVHCVIEGVPAGVGEPVFGRLDADLASAMMSINAVKGVEIGDGFQLASACGSEVLDGFTYANGKITTTSNHSGGIQGGISNGSPITLNVAFKPVATIMREIKTINRQGEVVALPPKGRHDPCVVARAVPIVEAMAAIVVLDSLLQQRAYRDFV